MKIHTLVFCWKCKQKLSHTAEEVPRGEWELDREGKVVKESVLCDTCIRIGRLMYTLTD